MNTVKLDISWSKSIVCILLGYHSLLDIGYFFTFISIKLFVGYYSTLEYKGMYFVSWVNIVKDETFVCFLVSQIPFWWQFCFDAHNISRPIWKNFKWFCCSVNLYICAFPFSSKMSVNMYMIFPPDINIHLLCTIQWCL